MKWLQRYKDKEIKEGDSNTRYYHAKVNGRRGKNRIFSLVQEEGKIEGGDELVKYITNFYKDLFGPAPGNLCKLREDMWESEEKLTYIDNFILTRPFYETEIKKC